MHIVFLGNCQVLCLATIMKRFVAPYETITTDFIDAYHEVDQPARDRLAKADLVVAQAASRPPPLDHSQAPAGVPVHLVPLVNGSFLYPYQGVSHPLAPKAHYGNAPYPEEYNDRFLARLITAGVSPTDAVAHYRAHDVAAQAHVGRLYELAMEGQAELDARTGYACAAIISTYLTQEQLFQSAYHYGGRIARHIASILFERLGFDTKYGARVQAHLREAPFMPRFVPVHPDIARHFGLGWVTPSTTYPFLWEGAFTFDQYVERFMRAAWNPQLQEGVLDSRQGKPEARAKLEAGLAQSPGSAFGAHEMSRVHEREGDLPGAIAWQRQAVALSDTAEFPVRLGQLLRKAGDVAGAEGAFSDAVQRDPVSPFIWRPLRDLRMLLGRVADALHAAEQAVLYDPDTEGAMVALQRVQAIVGRM